MRRWLILLWLWGFGCYAAPQRLISLAPHTTEMICQIGACFDLVAVDMASDFPAEISHLPRLDALHGFNLEAVLALKPDLVLAWHETPALKRLQEFGIRVEYLAPESPNELPQNLERLGQLIGRDEVGKQQANLVQQRLDRLRIKYQQMPQRSYLYQLWHAPLTLAGKNSWMAQALTLCHAETTLESAQPYPVLSIEPLLKQSPEFLISTAPIDQDLLPYSSMQVIYTDANILHRLSPRMLDELEPLCQQLHEPIPKIIGDAARRQASESP